MTYGESLLGVVVAVGVGLFDSKDSNTSGREVLFSPCDEECLFDACDRAKVGNFGCLLDIFTLGFGLGLARILGIGMDSNDLGVVAMIDGLLTLEVLELSAEVI